MNSIRKNLIGLIILFTIPCFGQTKKSFQGIQYQNNPQSIQSKLKSLGDTLLFFDGKNFKLYNSSDNADFNFSNEDLDALTPNNAGAPTKFGFFNSLDAANDFMEGDVDSAFYIAATSWFNPADQANNWFGFGPITIPAAGGEFSWYNKSNPGYTDGYKVYVSHTSEKYSDKEVDACGPIYTQNDNSNNPPASDTVWTKNTVSLGAYAGQKIYIGFNHIANDMDVIYLDHVLIKEKNNASCLSNTSLSSYNCGSTANNSYLNIIEISTVGYWSASVTSGNSWLSTSSSGCGNGYLSITVQENTSINSRTGTIQICNQNITITQPGVECYYTLSQSSFTCADYTATTYANIATINTYPGCSWTSVVTSGGTWLSSTSNGNDDGSISITVLENTSSTQRTGVIEIQDQVLTVIQPGQSGGGCIDTTFITIYDTVLITITDTIYAIVTDTNYISVTDTLLIDVTLTGIPEPNNNNTIKVYPNPTNDILVIDNGNFVNMSNYKLQIINSLGQNVFNAQITTPQFQIPVSLIGPEGTYFIQVINSNSQIVSTKTLILN